MIPAAPASLSAQLRAATKTLHREAEQSGLMSEVLHGRITRAAYCALLRNLHAIYAGLEPALRANEMREPGLIQVNEPALAREPALAADLDALHGPCWRQELPVSAAAERYVARVRWLAEFQPLDLAAHAYVRYLGDLSGGQMLHGIVARALKLDDPAAGLAFYRFAEPGPALLAARFRIGLDRLPLPDAAATNRFIDEAKRGFVLHKELFEALAVEPAASGGSPVP